MYDRRKFLNLIQNRGEKYMKRGNISEKVEQILSGKKIITESLETIIGDRLKPHGIKYAIIGGHAVTIHGHPRTTNDIDILVKPADMSKISILLHGHDAVELQSPRPDRPIEGISFITGNSMIDLIWIDQPWANEAINLTIDTKYGRIIDKPYLVLSKLWASRGEQDDADIISVMRMMSDSQLKLTTELVNIYFKQDTEDFEQMVQIAKI